MPSSRLRTKSSTPGRRASCNCRTSSAVTGGGLLLFLGDDGRAAYLGGVYRLDNLVHFEDVLTGTGFFRQSHRNGGQGSDERLYVRLLFQQFVTERRIEFPTHGYLDFAVGEIFRQDGDSGFELRAVGACDVQPYQYWVLALRVCFLRE